MESSKQTKLTAWLVPCKEAEEPHGDSPDEILQKVQQAEIQQLKTSQERLENMCEGLFDNGSVKESLWDNSIQITEADAIEWARQEMTQDAYQEDLIRERAEEIQDGEQGSAAALEDAMLEYARSRGSSFSPTKSGWDKEIEDFVSMQRTGNTALHFKGSTKRTDLVLLIRRYEVAVPSEDENEDRCHNCDGCLWKTNTVEMDTCCCSENDAWNKSPPPLSKPEFRDQAMACDGFSLTEIDGATVKHLLIIPDGTDQPLFNLGSKLPNVVALSLDVAFERSIDLCCLKRALSSWKLKRLDIRQCERYGDPEATCNMLRGVSNLSHLLSLSLGNFREGTVEDLKLVEQLEGLLEFEYEGGASNPESLECTLDLRRLRRLHRITFREDCGRSLRFKAPGESRGSRMQLLLPLQSLIARFFWSDNTGLGLTSKLRMELASNCEELEEWVVERVRRVFVGPPTKKTCREMEALKSLWKQSRSDEAQEQRKVGERRNLAAMALVNIPLCKESALGDQVLIFECLLDNNLSIKFSIGAVEGSAGRDSYSTPYGDCYGESTENMCDEDHEMDRAIAQESMKGTVPCRQGRRQIDSYVVNVPRSLVFKRLPAIMGFSTPVTNEMLADNRFARVGDCVYFVSDSHNGNSGSSGSSGSGGSSGQTCPVCHRMFYNTPTTSGEASCIQHLQQKGDPEHRQYRLQNPTAMQKQAIKNKAKISKVVSNWVQRMGQEKQSWVAAAKKPRLSSEC
jgi:hypothetical protein